MASMISKVAGAGANSFLDLATVGSRARIHLRGSTALGGSSVASRARTHLQGAPSVAPTPVTATLDPGLSAGAKARTHLNAPAPTPAAASTNPMNAVKSTGSIFSTPRAAVPGQSSLGWGAKGFAAMGGGFAANMFSDPDQRGVGTFVKGAAAGFAGASLLSKGLDTGFLSQGMSKVTARSRGRALARGGESWSAGATKMAQGMESAQSRGMMFAGGAMLSGGLIGSGHSKAHGMNAQRGNRFGG